MAKAKHPDSIKNISRFDYDRTDFQGWRVSKEIRGVRFTKYFPDKAHSRSKDPKATSLKKAKKFLKDLKATAATKTRLQTMRWATKGECTVKLTSPCFSKPWKK